MSRQIKFQKETQKAGAAGPLNVESRPGGWKIALVNGQRRRFFIQTVNNQVFFNLAGRQGLGQLQERSAGHSGAADITDAFTAHFPGKVAKVFAKDGQTVAAGEVLLMVEAMKMEFAIKAPCAGKVLKIKVQAGQQVQPGTQFLEFEEAKNGEK